MIFRNEKKSGTIATNSLAWLFAVVMVVALALSGNIAYATELADNNVTNQGSLTDYNVDSFGSYEDAVSAAENNTSETGLQDEGTYVSATSQVPTYGSTRTAGAYLREKMVARAETVTFKLNNNGFYSMSESDASIEGKIRALYFEIRDEAFAETVVYNQCAYLMWNWAGTNVMYSYNETGVTYKCSISYLSTAYQEQRIDNEVNRLLNNEFAGWENMSNYERVKMVYAWVTANYEYVEGTSNHSTYSGIIQHKTVCQGYATSIYRLLGEMGLNVRVVSNDSHGWNIVQLGQYWYNMDATWDEGKTESRWLYFLPSDYYFTYLTNHIRGEEYDTEEYHSAHPMASGAYDSADNQDAISVYYRTHIQDVGWQNFKYDGDVGGTTGRAKRLEAIEIKLGDTGEYDLGIQYKTHIQNIGWEKDWVKNGAQSGTSGRALRLEAIKIQLTGADADKFDVYYRVHAQDYGWMGWAKNGAPAGTAAQAKRLEGIQIMVLKKGDTPEGLLGLSYVDYGSESSSTNDKEGLVNYRVHVQDYGWQGFVFDGSVSGTSGKAKRLEGIYISLGDTGYEGGISYTTHIQDIGWPDDLNNPDTWSKDGQLAGTTGQSKRLEGICIKLYGEVEDHYDIYYRVHAQDYGWLDWAKNGQMAGTSGLSKRLEAIQIVMVPKDSQAPGSTARPAVTN